MHTTAKLPSQGPVVVQIRLIRLVIAAIPVCDRDARASSAGSTSLCVPPELYPTWLGFYQKDLIKIDHTPFSGHHHDAAAFERALRVDCLRHVLCTPHTIANSKETTSLMSQILHDNSAEVTAERTEIKRSVNMIMSAINTELKNRASMPDGASDVHYDTANLMLSEFDNSTGSQMSISAPNLHLSTTRPLDAEILSEMPSALAGKEAVIQQALAMMHVTEDTCVNLLAKVRDSNTYDDLVNGFLCKTGKNNAMNTRLMRTFVANFHPSSDARSVRVSHIDPSLHEKENFARALAAALEANDRRDAGLARAMQDLTALDVQKSTVELNTFFHSKCSVLSQISLPSFLTETEARQDFGRKLSIDALPLKQGSNVSCLGALPAETRANHQESYVKMGACLVPGLRGKMILPCVPERRTCVIQPTLSTCGALS